MQKLAVLFGLVASAVATNPPKHETEVIYTTTTVCPVTTTIHKPGTTVCETNYVTSTIVVTAGKDVTVTQKGPDVTKTQESTVYETSYSLCPVTVTKTINGVETCIVQTTTSTIVKPVPTTKSVYTTQETTKYRTTDVITTELHPVVTYTTVVDGKTVEVCVTNTKTVTLTNAYTVTNVQVATVTKHVEVTAYATVGSGATVTQESLVYVTQQGTTFISQVAPPVTVVAPATSTVVAAPTTVSTTGPAQVTVNAAGAQRPVIGLVAAIAGAAVLL